MGIKNLHQLIPMKANTIEGSMKNYGRNLKKLLDQQVIPEAIMKKNIRFNSDDDLPLKKILELHNMIIIEDILCIHFFRCMFV